MPALVSNADSRGVGNPDPSHKEAFYEASGLVISTGTTHWSYCSAVR
jgi:hypothetical protein